MSSPATALPDTHRLLLAQFLAPMGPDEFLSEFYASKPVHIVGSAQRFSETLSWDAFNDILEFAIRDSTRVRLSKDNRILDRSLYTRSAADEFTASATQFDLSRLNEALRDGATLVINHLEELHAPIAAHGRLLEYVFGSFCEVAVFAGWHRSQAFATHWDAEDVFVTQIVGRKRWTLFAPELRHLSVRDRSRALTPPTGTPYWEGELRAGDVLYVPRGWWHHALPLAEPTLHASFGLRPQTGIDLTQHVLDALRTQSELLRASVPRFAGPDAKAAYLRRLRETIMVAMEELTVDSFLAETDSLAPGRQRPSLPWSADPESQPLEASVWVQWLPPRAARMRVTDDGLVVDSQGSTFTFEVVALPIIEHLMTAPPSTLESLCKAFPTYELVPFLTQLVSLGLLSISNAKPLILPIAGAQTCSTL